MLKSATLGAYIFQGGRSTWSFFASQGFILSIPNPKHQQLPWDSFFVDPGKDDPGSTFCEENRVIGGVPVSIISSLFYLLHDDELEPINWVL